MHTRGLQYFTISEIEPRIWFMLRGCNFHCRGCFRPARDEGGAQLTAAETLARMGRACLDYYGELPSEAMITGGEPTLDKEYYGAARQRLEDARVHQDHVDEQWVRPG